MISHTTEQFRKLFIKLPANIKKQANNSYAQFRLNPYYPGLRFKRVHSILPIYSVRISKNYRAIGTLKEDVIIWFWIGSHEDYNKLLLNL